VLQLLKRGEDPKLIRVLDIRLPSRMDLKEGLAVDVDFRIVDISNADAVNDAFNAPWPEYAKDTKLTVLHTAANIRFYERHESMLHNSSRVNVAGTQNVLNAARAVGASTMVYTSSGSVSVRSSHFLLWPWQKEPKYFVQTITDDDSLLPKRHEDFFSNYAASKCAAERLVRSADSPTDGFRTGCIRPGNGVFGPGGDMLCGAYLVRKTNPTWISNIIQNFVYVENCALAHLLYEQRLMSPDPEHDLGGQAFNICDPGPPRTYGDVYLASEVLTDGETHFPELSPTGMLFFAYLVEGYYLLRHFWLHWLPAVNSDLVNLQPSLYNLTMVHLIFDDSRARLAPEMGGLGYRGAWDTLEGLWKTAMEHKKGVNHSFQRSDNAGVSFGFGYVRAQRGVAKIGEKVEEETGVKVL
jgi:nucleoside-diphosphate-sugar epimerase